MDNLAENNGILNQAFMKSPGGIAVFAPEKGNWIKGMTQSGPEYGPLRILRQLREKISL